MDCLVDGTLVQRRFVMEQSIDYCLSDISNQLPYVNDNEWNVFEYMHARVVKIIPLSELRDKVVYQHFGPKLPARWFNSIQNIVSNIRRQIQGIDGRLLTVKNVPVNGITETGYIFQ